jgi:hypothetical protein
MMMIIIIIIISWKTTVTVQGMDYNSCLNHVSIPSRPRNLLYWLHFPRILRYPHHRTQYIHKLSPYNPRQLVLYKPINNEMSVFCGHKYIASSISTFTVNTQLLWKRAAWCPVLASALKQSLQLSCLVPCASRSIFLSFSETCLSLLSTCKILFFSKSKLSSVHIYPFFTSACFIHFKEFLYKYLTGIYLACL